MEHRRPKQACTVIGCLVAGSLTLAPLAAGAAAPAATSRAGVVVDEGNGSVKRVGITFSGTITGIKALQLAGFDPSVRSFGGIGGAVCAIAIGATHYGCPTDTTCLTCADPDYWAYSRAPAGTRSFTNSRVGAGATTVHDGDIEGWRWGTGDTPAYLPLDKIFPPATTTTATTTPTSHPPVTNPHGTTPRGPSTTSAAVDDQQVPGASSTTATTNRTTSTTARNAKHAKHGITTTSRRRATGSAVVTTARGPTSARDGPSRSGARKLAAAPPTVHDSSNTSPIGWIAFALIVALFGAAIVAAHRRRARAATE